MEGFALALTVIGAATLTKAILNLVSWLEERR